MTTTMRACARSARLPWRSLLVAMTAALATAACAHRPPSPAEPSPDSEAFASHLIAEKVAVASHAQREFAQMQAEHRAEIAVRQYRLDSDVIDVDYIGSPQELLQTMANRYGYTYVEIGRHTALKPVNVRFASTSPIELLRSVGHQVHASADVVLDKGERTIRLIYKNPSEG